MQKFWPSKRMTVLLWIAGRILKLLPGLNSFRFFILRLKNLLGEILLVLTGSSAIHRFFSITFAAPIKDGINPCTTLRWNGITGFNCYLMFAIPKEEYGYFLIPERGTEQYPFWDFVDYLFGRSLHWSSPKGGYGEILFVYRRKKQTIQLTDFWMCMKIKVRSVLI